MTRGKFSLTLGALVVAGVLMGTAGTASADRDGHRYRHHRDRGSFQFYFGPSQPYRYFYSPYDSYYYYPAPRYYYYYERPYHHRYYYHRPNYGHYRYDYDRGHRHYRHYRHHR